MTFVALFIPELSAALFTVPPLHLPASEQHPATPTTPVTPTIPTTPTTPGGRSRQTRPLPPPPYAHRMKGRSISDSALTKYPLSRARSCENLLSSSPGDEDSFFPPQRLSPPAQHRKFEVDRGEGPAPPLPSRVPILPPRDPASAAKNFVDGAILGRAKPRPAKTKRSIGNEKPQPRGGALFNRPTTPESDLTNARLGRLGSCPSFQQQQQQQQQPPTSPQHQCDHVFTTHRPPSPVSQPAAAERVVQPVRPMSPQHERVLHNRTTSPPAVHSRQGSSPSPAPLPPPPLTLSSSLSSQENQPLFSTSIPESHKPLAHTISEPSFVDSNFPRTFVAVDSYSPQAEGCLSFSAGDKCVLIQKTPNGWWLVNLGGREGWVPGEYWNEEIRVRFGEGRVLGEGGREGGGVVGNDLIFLYVTDIKHLCLRY